MIFYPFENIRTRLQAEVSSIGEVGREVSTGTETTNASKKPTLTEAQKEERIQRRKRSYLRILSKIIREEGYLSFYKGMKMALIGTVVSSITFFFGYRMYKNLVLHKLKIFEKDMTSKHIMLVTILAGVSSSLSANPFWMTNARMTVSKGKQSMRECIKEIYNEGGIWQFYRGVAPNLILVLNPTINYVLYEAIKKYLSMGNEKNVSALKIFIASSIGKIAATFATYPILTVRVRLQTAKNKQGDVQVSQLELFKKLLQEL